MEMEILDKFCVEGVDESGARAMFLLEPNIGLSPVVCEHGRWLALGIKMGCARWWG